MAYSELRAKINMSSSNMQMRDPIIYRILDKKHHRTGEKWKIYPMYDWTHGQSDYIEKISHSLCTLEFEVHRELYGWFLDQIFKPKSFLESAKAELEKIKRNTNNIIFSIF